MGAPRDLLERAAALNAAGRSEEAAALCDELLARDPGLALAWRHKGAALRALRRMDEAVLCFDRIAALEPDNAAAHLNRGAALVEAGRPGEALESFDRALALDPRNALALVNRSGALFLTGRVAEALDSAEQAVAQDAAQAAAHFHRASALRALGRIEEAIAALDRFLVLKPGRADALLNRAAYASSLLRLDDAVADYEAVLRLKPGHVEARWNLATCLLKLGRLREGFALYECRWERAEAKAYRPNTKAPLWLGREPLAGKTIYLRHEQGLGDTLQFCRYAPMAAALGARVLLGVQPPLVGLLQGLEGVAEVFGATEPEAFDFQSPLVSLPHAFGTALETVPARIPYLKADPAKAEAWARRLGPRARLRVGLVWQGGDRPGRPKIEALNAARNVPLGDLAAALAGLDADFVSLQVGDKAEAELRRHLADPAAQPRIRDVAAQLTDFSETAALVESLDLVIAVDTAVAHLAGALGKPVWLPTRYDGEWRWLHEREDSPWYPTARLFRQPAPGDWRSVLSRMRGELRRLAA